MLSACAAPAPVNLEVTRIVPQTVVATQVVTQVVTQLVTVIVTATPIPPTATPIATPTLVFERWTSAQVVDAFKNAGLEVENTTPMTKDDYGLAPLSAIEGTHFIIPSLCADCGGRIFSFASEEDLILMKDYYQNLGKSSAAFFSWVFVKDNVLVQINGDLAETKANQYQDALNNLR